METLGLLGFVFGLVAFAKVIQLEKSLKKSGILREGSETE